MATLFEKFESTINQRMSTVKASIKNSLSDLKSKFIEKQNALVNYDDRITELESNKGQGEQNCKMSQKTNQKWLKINLLTMSKGQESTICCSMALIEKTMKTPVQ